MIVGQLWEIDVTTASIGHDAEPSRFLEKEVHALSTSRLVLEQEQKVGRIVRSITVSKLLHSLNE